MSRYLVLLRGINVGGHGPCSNCGTTLLKGTEAIWRHRERRMLRLSCGAM